MDRVLTFNNDEKSRDRFRILYESLIHGGAMANALHARGQTGKKPFDDVRREAKLLAMFEAISVEDSEARLATGEPSRKLKDTGEIVMDQPQHDMLKKYAESCDWKVSMSIAVVDAVDFLSAAQSKES